MEKFLIKYMFGREKRLGHRRDKKIAFDVDMTLIDEHDRPIYHNINLMLWFVDRGYDVIMWSGGGVSYAEMWARKLGFEDVVRIVEKGKEEVDIAFDDETAQLGKINVEV